MSVWEQHGEKIYALHEDGSLAARVCVAANMDRATEIMRLHESCSTGACCKARSEFVRGMFAGMEALAAEAMDVVKACRKLGVTAEEAEEVARGTK